MFFSKMVPNYRGKVCFCSQNGWLKIGSFPTWSLQIHCAHLRLGEWWVVKEHVHQNGDRRWYSRTIELDITRENDDFGMILSCRWSVEWKNFTPSLDKPFSLSDLKELSLNISSQTFAEFRLLRLSRAAVLFVINWTQTELIPMVFVRHLVSPRVFPWAVKIQTKSSS